MNVSSDVKVVGKNGQITLGKEFAGRIVEVEQREPGVWVIRAGTFVPDSERWLHTPSVDTAIQRGLAKLKSSAPADRLDELEKVITDANQQSEGTD